jgi:hypothetical protein
LRYIEFFCRVNVPHLIHLVSQRVTLRRGMHTVDYLTKS